MEEQFPQSIKMIPALLLQLLQTGQGWYPTSTNEMHTSEEGFLSQSWCQTCCKDVLPEYKCSVHFIQATILMVALGKPLGRYYRKVSTNRSHPHCKRSFCAV